HLVQSGAVRHYRRLGVSRDASWQYTRMYCEHGTESLSARALPKRQPCGELDILCGERTDTRARYDDTQEVERISSSNAQRRFGRSRPSHGSQKIDRFGPCELLA